MSIFNRQSPDQIYTTGAAVAVGNILYMGTDGLVRPAKADSGSTSGLVIGVALTLAGSSGDIVWVRQSGLVNVVIDNYFNNTNNAGGICILSWQTAGQGSTIKEFQDGATGGITGAQNGIFVPIGMIVNSVAAGAGSTGTVQVQLDICRQNTFHSFYSASQEFKRSGSDPTSQIYAVNTTFNSLTLPGSGGLLTLWGGNTVAGRMVLKRFRGTLSHNMSNTGLTVTCNLRINGATSGPSLTLASDTTAVPNNINFAIDTSVAVLEDGDQFDFTIEFGASNSGNGTFSASVNCEMFIVSS